VTHAGHGDGCHNHRIKEPEQEYPSEKGNLPVSQQLGGTATVFSIIHKECTHDVYFATGEIPG
jgi:hypothetical protein